ncbi:MAG TPA: SNF2-related protein [Phycisphaerae bacterium]|jgi:superfamily II DNA or RNA helicase
MTGTFQLVKNSLRHLFSAANRRQGEQYVREGRVKLAPVDKTGCLVAEVKGQGGRTYEVNFYPDFDEPDILCTCNDESWDGYCAHGWATVLAIESDASIRSGIELGLSAIKGLTPAKAPVPTKAPRRATIPYASISMPTGTFRVPFPGFGSADRFSQLQPPSRPQAGPRWQDIIETLQRNGSGESPGAANAPTEVLPYYVLEIPAIRANGQMQLFTGQRALRKNGKLGRIKALSYTPAHLPQVAHSADRLITLTLAGAQPKNTSSYYSYYGYVDSYGRRSRWVLEPEVVRALLPALFETGRFLYRESEGQEPVPLRRDEGAAWQLVLRVRQADRGSSEVSFTLARGAEQRPLKDTRLIMAGEPGLCLLDGALADLELFGCPCAMIGDIGEDPLRIPLGQTERFVKELSSLPAAPRLDLPQPWSLDVVSDVQPAGQLELSTSPDLIFAQVSYRYGGTVVPGMRPGATVIDATARRQLVRNRKAEAALDERLAAAGFDRALDGRFAISAKKLLDAVRCLAAEGWTILADGRRFRQAGEIDIQVSSGIDWFDVDAKVDFDGISASLPALLAAVRSGERYVRLDDGSVGMLPEEWLARNGLLLGFGRVEGDRLRFSRTQAFLLDQMLAQQSRVQFDPAFGELRDKLRAFEGVPPCAAPPTFVGQLRPYQQHGLGWLNFLDEFGWGGCLADDMGLGKTVQLLAWLAARKGSGFRVQDSAANAGENSAQLPSLAVVPRSVVFNWVDEARRFTPELRVLTYHGTGRHAHLPKLDDYDLVITTYQTLRRDVTKFTERMFDCVILDEAQAVKNAKAQSAKAVRLLQARRRLALTGTPVENRLADLWSLFDFLNPGMLGAVGAFQTAFVGGNGASGENRDMLRRALRPFLLRRTKEAVAPELPPKTEETVYCEMTADQAKRYAELRDFYRAIVLGKVKELGLARAKIHVLEALLRLRQAAIHPALLDEKIAIDESGKVEALLPMIEEVIEGGHKALVFSQFTSFLAILRKLLDKQRVTYEYLDGATRDRRERVERFQTDAACPLFLISLKAGGLGLNLTAADYVFILDPWWNPAVEAQAVDRAHRIGQDKHVIAYRLIARGTVEEKILDLQNRKRDLAASIITEANSLISELTREDLEVLLS